MSKYQTTMYNRYCRVKQAVESVHRQTRSFKLTCDEHIALRNKLVFTKDYERLNQYYTGKISGMDELLFHQIQTEHVDWLHYYTAEDGRIVYCNKWEMLPEDVRENKTFKSGHFWRNSDFKPWSLAKENDIES